MIVTKIDQLARSAHLDQTINFIRKKQAGLQILNLGIDTSNVTGELILNVMASIAQFERCIMLERQREGIAKAKADGKYRGCTATAREQTDEVQKLKNSGMSPGRYRKP